MYIISSCLLGHQVRYDGKGYPCQWVLDFAKSHSVFHCCPEILGGLPCPRAAAEIQGNQVVTAEGKDITEEFEKGARLALEQAMTEATKRGQQIEGAILKSKSPSCGLGTVYDGTFSSRLVSGNGKFAALLIENSIKVWTEETNDKL